jgi:hypothetical protein
MNYYSKDIIETEAPGADRLMKVSEAYNILTNLNELLKSDEPLTLVEKARIQHEIYLWAIILRHKRGTFHSADPYYFFKAYIFDQDIIEALNYNNNYFKTVSIPHAINQLK